MMEKTTAAMRCWTILFCSHRINNKLLVLVAVLLLPTAEKVSCGSSRCCFPGHLLLQMQQRQLNWSLTLLLLLLALVLLLNVCTGTQQQGLLVAVVVLAVVVAAAPRLVTGAYLCQH
jgi:hypothetical protein